MHGGTIRQASAAKALELLRGAEQLATITELIDALLLANLPEAVQAAVSRLESEVAVADDIQALLSALPPLVRIRRYGNVRGTDTTTLTGVIDGIVPRICIGLSQACQSLDEEAGRAMMALLEETSQALRLLDEAGYLESWWRAVTTLSSLVGVNGLVGGKCYRLLLDAGMMAADDAAEQLHFVLSRGSDPAEQAAWVEGLLDGSGLLLVHDDKLWSIVDDWLCGLEQDPSSPQEL